MSSQKFFCVDIEYINADHTLDRGLLQSWLQFFYNSNLTGKMLAEKIGNVVLHVYTIDIKDRVSDYGDRW